MRHIGLILLLAVIGYLVLRITSPIHLNFKDEIVRHTPNCSDPTALQHLSNIIQDNPVGRITLGDPDHVKYSNMLQVSFHDGLRVCVATVEVYDRPTIKYSIQNTEDGNAVVTYLPWHTIARPSLPQ